MNRIRHGYLEMVPGLEPYFVTSPYDDAAGILATYGETIGSGEPRAERRPRPDHGDRDGRDDRGDARSGPWSPWLAVGLGAGAAIATLAAVASFVLGVALFAVTGHALGHGRGVSRGGTLPDAAARAEVGAARDPGWTGRSPARAASRRSSPSRPGGSCRPVLPSNPPRASELTPVPAHPRRPALRRGSQLRRARLRHPGSASRGRLRRFDAGVGTHQALCVRAATCADLKTSRRRRRGAAGAGRTVAGRCAAIARPARPLLVDRDDRDDARASRRRGRPRPAADAGAARPPRSARARRSSAGHPDRPDAGRTGDPPRSLGCRGVDSRQRPRVVDRRRLGSRPTGGGPPERSAGGPRDGE